MICPKCGANVADDIEKCPVCGEQLKTISEMLGKKAEAFNNGDDHTLDYDSADIENSKILSLFSYIGILFLIPLIAKPQSKYARFHINQGLVLFIFEAVEKLIVKILDSIMIIKLPITIADWICDFVFLVFAILGIVNAVSGAAKELPVIGKIKLFK